VFVGVPAAEYQRTEISGKSPTRNSAYASTVSHEIVARQPVEIKFERSIMTTSDVEILKTAYGDFARGDVPAVMARFAENIAWHIPGDHLVSGDYTGHGEVLGFFGRLGELSGGAFTVDVDEILDDGRGTLAALTTINAERGGKRGSFETVQVWRFEDGLATSFREYHDRQDDINAFWS
jgi:ketosteroid isomerase-like protein